MNISCLQENITKAVARATRIIGNKPQVPILSYVFLVAKDQEISITSTNLELSFKTKISGKIDIEGACCLPARLLSDFLATLPKETVNMKKEEQSIVISAGRSKATIPTLPAEEFPSVFEQMNNSGEEVSKETLLASLEHILFAAATDEARPMLTGIKIEQAEKNLTLVATDGYRLSLYSFPSEKHLFSTDLVVPAKALHELVKLGNEEKTEERISLSETLDGQLLFSLGDAHLSTRKIEGDYPPYRKIIPAHTETKKFLETQEFLQAVRSASLFARESAGVVKLKIERDTLSVSANTPQIGENVVQIEAEGEGEGGEVAINSRFLLDLLGTIKSEQIIMEITGALNPCVFKLPKEDSFLHIIMPVRIQN